MQTSPESTTTPQPDQAGDPEWHASACILCSINCGIEVRLDDRRLARIRGDKSHPGSTGYTCEKGLRLDAYQNHPGRLTTPLRRRADGSFEAIEWDEAIAGVADRLMRVRDEHGGASIFYYGGGAQGNHLGGSYGRALQAAAGVRYSSNALAQEKTGEFWVDGQLFGRPRCHTTGDYEHAEVAVFVGKNPWQSHGFPRARTVLKAIANDPARSLIVIDPRVTETAALADIHLQVRPGTDAWCLSALLAVLIGDDLVDHDFINEHTQGFGDLRAHFDSIDVAANCAISGIAESDLRAAAHRIAAAASVSIFEDLGIQMAPQSTLNSYLEKLVFLLTGNFAKEGGMNLHSSFASLGGGSGASGEPRASVTPVTGQRIIAGLIPASAIPDEILTDHPDRFRAAIIESSNPVHSLPDSPRMREALDALDFVVVIDVALTETARHADFVLPAASQFEKWEMTFFNLEFPHNVAQLRAPLLEPLAGTLPEPEIHRRLVRAMGACSDADLAPLHEAAAAGRAEFADAFLGMMFESPQLARLAPVVLYETLGPTLGAGREATAVVWALAQTCFMGQAESVRRAGFDDAESLFDALLTGRGVTFSVDPYDETWNRMATDDRRIRLVITELLEELAGLPDGPVVDPEFPFVLAAGERRSSTANTALRDPDWRKSDAEGRLRMNPDDARAIGATDGSQVTITTRRGTAVAAVEVNDTMQRGHVSLPNGFGLRREDAAGTPGPGVAPNELTSTADRDWLAGTPWHKHVPARIELVPAT